MQEIAWYSSLFLMAATVAVFGVVLRTSGNVAQVSSIAQERLRRMLLAAALMVCLPLTFFSLIHLPYHQPTDRSAPIKAVDVVGRQWNWELSENTFQVGDRVAFHVSSKDVNHDFALYDPDMHVVTQTQAMPGYVNTLSYQFQNPGTYTVMCLEYCGVSHHDMTTEIKVLPH